MEVIKYLPDTELVQRLRDGKQVDETIRLLYRDHFESLSWYILNNSGNRQDAEDVFQEVLVSFIGLVQKDRFRGESSIKTFLYSLNRHIWLNELKRRGRAMAREEKFERAQDRITTDVSNHIADRESRADVIRLVEQLGEHCRQILVMFYYENRSMKEILGAMHYENEQVVRNKKYKCLKQLEEMIREKPYLKQTIKNLLHE